MRTPAKFLTGHERTFLLIGKFGLQQQNWKRHMVTFPWWTKLLTEVRKSLQGGMCMSSHLVMSILVPFLVIVNSWSCEKAKNRKKERL